MNETEHNPVALITGAGRGIGRAIALALARDGFDLALSGRSPEQLEQTRAASGLEASRSLIVLADLTDVEAPAAIIETVIEHFGRIDALVNNAGYAPPRRMLVKTSELEQDRMLAVNLRAPIALARLAAPHMIARGSGTIVNIASATARLAPAGEAIYAATKAGLLAFSHALFEELREHQIKVSAILPGLVDTAFVPPNKRLDRAAMLQPDDVAAAVLSIVKSSPASCPLELTLLPQRAPEK